MNNVVTIENRQTLPSTDAGIIEFGNKLMRVVENTEDLKQLADYQKKGSKLAELAETIGAGIAAQNAIARPTILAEWKIGQALTEIRPHGANQHSEEIFAKDLLRFGHNTLWKFRKIARLNEFERDAYFERTAREEAGVINRNDLIRIVDASEGRKTLHSSESNEWYTPAVYIEAARAVMGSIDLDPASNAVANETVQAESYFDAEDDGLEQAWYGNVWLNPPYGKTNGASHAALWTERLIHEYAVGSIDQAVLLVNAVPSNDWFRPLWDFFICFTDHRIKFYSPSGKPKKDPTHSNCFVYLGKNQEAFVREFSTFGAVVSRVDL